MRRMRSHPGRGLVIEPGTSPPGLEKPRRDDSRPAHFQMWTDGGARGNPGPAGIGVVLRSPDGRIVAEIAEGIGLATNNVAEYQGLIEGMRLARQQGVDKLEVYLDSVLVVQQMKGVFKVKHPGLKPLHQTAVALASQFKEVRFQAVPREQNAHADKLVNQGIDAWLSTDPPVDRPEPAQRGLF